MFNFDSNVESFIMLIILVGIAAALLSHFKIIGVPPILILGGLLILVGSYLHLVDPIISSIGYILFGLGLTMVYLTFSQNRNGAE